jgi:protein phosphatase 4 regulatory subunit 3
MKEHSESIRTLATGEIVGTRFQNLIRRWEQNNEPPPLVTDIKREEYVSRISMTEPSSHLNFSVRPNRLDRGRGLDSEEDDWFNGSDEDDLASPKLPWMQQPQRLSQIQTLKRKRAPTVIEYPMRQRQYPPSPTPTNSPPSTALVDYDDEDASPSDEDAGGAKLNSNSKTPHSPDETSDSCFTSREKTPKPIKIPVLGNVRAIQTMMFQDKGSPLNTVLPPTRVEKRQRDDEEDDEWMARLAAKSKRPSISEAWDELPPKQPSIRLALGKMSEGAKKIKLNLGLGRKMEMERRASDKDDERG